MKYHKTVTRKVLEANRINAKKSTGPKSDDGKLAVRRNAVKHGLLAKQILFRHNSTQRKEFKKMLDDLEHEYRPIGPVERMLVEEIGACWWRIHTATRFELKEFRNHREASRQVVEELNKGEADLKVLDYGFQSASHPQWECEALVIRSSKHTNDKILTPETVHTEIEATLKSSLPTILRYETTLKRDLYKAIHTLQELQRRRKEGRLRNKAK